MAEEKTDGVDGTTCPCHECTMIRALPKIKESVNIEDAREIADKALMHVAPLLWISVRG